MRSRFVPRLVSSCSVLVAASAFSPHAFATIPTGWQVSAEFDGGTSALGTSIATTASSAVVGASLATLTPNGAPVGAVYVYTSAGSSWTSQRLVAPTPVDGGVFGASVAAQGGLVAVGAPGTPPAAYLFSADAGAGYAAVHTWSDPIGDVNASFGSSVALSSGPGANYLAIAAPPESEDAGGNVYVSYQLADGGWSDPPVGISDPSASSFGISIAFAGNGQLLVGDPDTGSGQVLVYSPALDGGWTSEGPMSFVLEGGSVQSFGNSIATLGNLAVITAPSSADDAGTYNGVAFVFTYSDAGGWEQTAVLRGAADEAFGNFPPAVTESFIAMGSQVNTASTTTGLVDVWYEGSPGSWSPVPATALVGDPYYGEVVGWVGDSLFIADTSGGGGSSAIFVDDPMYEETDGGSPPASDAGVGGDAGAISDAGPIVGGLDASVNTDGGETTSGAGGGCSCAAAGSRSGNGLAAVLFGAVALFGARRRRSVESPSRG